MSDIVDFYTNHLITSFDKAEKEQSNLCPEIIEMQGMSGNKTRHFYNNLLNIPDARYLEVGVWKGSSTCSAVYNNKVDAVCIDNWTEIDNPRDAFVTNMEKYKGDSSYTLIEGNAFDIDISRISKRNIYMYDADHSAECQYKALEHYIDVMDDTFIYVTDDWNFETVRKGTLDAIDDLGLTQAFVKQISDYSCDRGPDDRLGWWCGIYAAVMVK